MSSASPDLALKARVVPYLQMARADHWFKNVFMLLGVLIAFLYRPETFAAASAWKLVEAVFAVCLVASSNYVLNEYLDAPMDRLHPTKCTRPAAAGLVSGPAALLWWGLLGIVGCILSFSINSAFGASALSLWVMGLVYNVPPIRSKDLPYVDVISESINNPIRLFLGWFALIPDVMPPISLAIAYWMLGAFFMASKRFAEYRRIGDGDRAASYRKSFAHYDEARLLGSMLCYVALGSVFAGIFVVRYKLELVFCAPITALFLGYYLVLSFREDSPVQAPERLYRERGFTVLACCVLGAFLALMFVDMPVVYDLFNVLPSSVEPLWKIG